MGDVGVQVFSEESNKNIDNLAYYLFRSESIEDTVNGHRRCLCISLTLTSCIFMLVLAERGGKLISFFLFLLWLLNTHYPAKNSHSPG